MRTVQTLVLISFVALAGFAATPIADADDCDCRGAAPGYRTARGTSAVSCNSSGTYHVRDPHHPSTRYVIPRHNRGARGYGSCRTRPSYGPWSELRPYLPNGRAEIRRLHVRNYFLRRYPFAQAAPGAEQVPGAIDTLLAIGNTELGSERALDVGGHLDRGMGRFYVADYDGAREDFSAVLAARSGEARARFGLLLVAVCKNDWPAAAGQLDLLAKAGQLRRGDRLEAAGSFAKPATFDAIVTGLRSYAGYRVNDGDAHLVTAWTLAAQGKDALAKRYLRLAKRWKPGNAAIAALASSLAPAAAQPAKAAPATPPPSTAPKPRAPKADLHGQIATLDR